MARYRVYVWKSRSAKAASIVEDITAQSIDNAINAVLLTHRLLKASYVWLICHDDDRIDVHRYNVQYVQPTLASLQAPVTGGRSHDRREKRR